MSHLPSPQTLHQVTSPEDLGLHVRSVRKSLELRIDDTASFSEVSVDLMSRLENGRSGVRLDKLLKVLDGLGLTLLVATKEEAERLVRAQGRSAQ